jgi:hypothetical protein
MQGPWRTFKMSVADLWRSRFFAQLAAIIAISDLALTCLQGFLFNYAEFTLGTGASSNTDIFTLFGAGKQSCGSGMWRWKLDFDLISVIGSLHIAASLSNVPCKLHGTWTILETDCVPPLSSP